MPVVCSVAAAPRITGEKLVKRSLLVFVTQLAKQITGFAFKQRLNFFPRCRFGKPGGGGDGSLAILEWLNPKPPPPKHPFFSRELRNFETKGFVFFEPDPSPADTVDADLDARLEKLRAAC